MMASGKNVSKRQDPCKQVTNSVVFSPSCSSTVIPPYLTFFGISTRLKYAMTSITDSPLKVV
jgi:hypothetical protein